VSEAVRCSLFIEVGPWSGATRSIGHVAVMWHLPLRYTIASDIGGEQTAFLIYTDS
jgi:hypothetical protein